MEATLETIAYRFRRPVVTSYGTLEQREVLRLRLETDGAVGIGEAAPLAPYDGVTLADVEDALAPALADLRRTAPDERHGYIPSASLPQAAAALNIAFHDLAARSAGVPLAAQLIDRPAASVPVNATIVATDPSEAAGEAAAAVADGFRCVKLKVGVGEDVHRVSDVRDAVGPDVAIRIDANGAWTVEEALAALEALAPAGIELCEEPVHGVEALAELRGRLDGALAIAMDETATDADACESGATDAVCLKVAACGGIDELLAAAADARAAGSDVYVSSTYDGPIGIAAGLHATAALGDVLPCGLATLSLFEDVDDPFPVRDGVIAVPSGPGLGLLLDP
jgi:o-succinylbenzoate synthase